MSASSISLRSPNPRKRSHPDDDMSEVAQATIEGATALTNDRIDGSIDLQVHCNKGGSIPPAGSESSRLTSPAPSSNGSVIRDTPALSTLSAQPIISTPAKKRKLTFAEKEAKKVEKELKDKRKAEEKARKDEGKRMNEEEKKRKEDEVKEEKRKREEEKEMKKRTKELEKAAKDEDKKRKEEEKAKKEKSQLRLNAFFAKPATPNTPADTTPQAECTNPLDGRRGSIGSVEEMGATTRSRSGSASPQKSTLSDYERAFPPFYLHLHTTLAPYCRFRKDREALHHARSDIDENLRSDWKGLGTFTGKRKALEMDAIEQLHIPPHKRMKRTKEHITVKQIVGRIHGTANDPIDLTEQRTKAFVPQPADLLKSIAMKHLQFAEDVRPPYRGTYTKLPIKKSASSLARNPFERALPQTDYDYDSEAEWEEPEDGEDLNSEREEEENGSEEGDDEMEGFLDDEDAGEGVGGVGNKRRHVVGDLEPVCSGLLWEDADGVCRANRDGEASPQPGMRVYKLQVILENHHMPIDPFSTAYWTDPNASIGALTINPISLNSDSTLMNPPRLPLHAINRTNTVINGLGTAPLALVDSTGKIVATTNCATSAKSQKPAKRQVAPELMPDFKRAIQGSDLTKAGLIEILKKQFPKTSKDAIKDTLSTIADRVGSKEADKRWLIKDGV